MLWAGVSAAVADGGGEQDCEVFYKLGIFLAQVSFFGRIGFEVVELHEGESFAFERGCGLGVTPAAGAGAESELPRAAADGEGAVDGMVDSEGAQWPFASFAQERGQKREGILGRIRIKINIMGSTSEGSLLQETRLLSDKILETAHVLKTVMMRVSTLEKKMESLREENLSEKLKNKHLNAELARERKQSQEQQQRRHRHHQQQHLLF